jgi:hypothetical protein
MGNTAWKQMERRVAKFMKGQRTPLSGSNSHQTSSDVIHPDLYIECKLRAHLSVASLYADTEKKAKKEKKIPVVVLKEKNKKGELYVIKSTYMEEFVNIVKEQIEQTSKKKNKKASKKERSGSK